MSANQTEYKANYSSIRLVVDQGKYFALALARRAPIAARRRLQLIGQMTSFRALAAQGAPRVAVRIAGGVGDQAIIARAVRDLTMKAPNLMVDVFSNDTALSRWLFAPVSGFHNAYIDSLFDSVVGEYDLAIAVSDTIEIKYTAPTFENANAGLIDSLAALSEFNSKHQAFLGPPLQRANFLAQILTIQGAPRHRALQHMLRIPYGGDALALSLDHTALEALPLEGRRFVTVHNGFGVDQLTSGRRSTKCYPHFDAVISQLRQRHPDIVFIQLGAANSPRLHMVDHRLLDRTTLPQAAALLAGSSLHLDIESGLVHVGRCVGAVSCVVFGPTNPDFFAYSDNITVRPRSCGGCWWLTPDWMNACPRGQPEPECTYATPPELVAEAASRALARRRDVESPR